jgi:FkbM family methyltransferase
MRLMRHALRAVRNAFFSPGFRLFGVRFARDYLRFAQRAIRRWGYTGPGEMQFLGYRVAYTNQTAALLLLHEIFVNAAYAFAGPPSRPRIIDCGANIGMSILFFKSYAPGCRILAIEPDPATFALLQRTIERNALTDIELLQAAVAGTDGTATLYGDASAGSITSSIRREWGGDTASTVTALRLSDLTTEPIDFLKLDVEGAEYEVIDDLAESGRLALVAEMIVECHALTDAPNARERLIARLRGAGFDVEIVSETGTTTSFVHGRARRTGRPSASSGTPSTSRTTSA